MHPKIEDRTRPTSVCSLERIKRRLAALDAAFRDLLDLSALEGGRFELQLQPVELTAVLQRVLAQSFAPEEQARIAIDASSAARVRADPARLERVLACLLLIALRHSTQETIRVVIRVRERRVLVGIVDLRVGGLARVAGALLPRPRDEQSPKTHSLGVGLQVARRIVEAHGGELLIATTLSRGTRLQFDLPAAE